MKESEKKVSDRFLKIKEVLSRAELSTATENRDAAAALGKNFYLKLNISYLENRHRIKTIQMFTFLNGAKKK